MGEEPKRWPLHVRVDPSRSPSAPVLDGATVFLDPAAAGSFVRRLVEAGTGTPGLSADLDGARLLEAALDRTPERWAALAAGAGLSPEPLATLAELAVAPIMRAIAERVAGAGPERWGEGYCPVCGAWPTLVEMRGLDRQRHLRCSRCGGGWRRDLLHCAYCGERDHERQKAFAAEGEEESRRVEACDSCSGYTKAIATLAATPAAELALEDLATVELDLVALERGYRRPDRPGHALGVRFAPLEERQLEEEGTWARAT